VGEPWLRMIAILVVVACVAVGSALLLNTRRVRERYGANWRSVVRCLLLSVAALPRHDPSNCCRFFIVQYGGDVLVLIHCFPNGGVLAPKGIIGSAALFSLRIIAVPTFPELLHESLIVLLLIRQFEGCVEVVLPAAW